MARKKIPNCEWCEDDATHPAMFRLERDGQCGYNAIDICAPMFLENFNDPDWLDDDTGIEFFNPDGPREYLDPDRALKLAKMLVEVS